MLGLCEATLKTENKTRPVLIDVLWWVIVWT
jgi:hypothetical protein